MFVFSQELWLISNLGGLVSTVTICLNISLVTETQTKPSKYQRHTENSTPSWIGIFLPSCLYCPNTHFPQYHGKWEFSSTEWMVSIQVTGYRSLYLTVEHKVHAWLNVGSADIDTAASVWDILASGTHPSYVGKFTQ